MDLLFSTNIEDKEVLFRRVENTESVRDGVSEDCENKTEISDSSERGNL